MFAHFGEALSRLRAQHHLSRSALAKRLGISGAEVGAIEASAPVPPKGIVAAIADCFSLSTDELLLVSGVVPEWAEKELREHPKQALSALLSLSQSPPIGHALEGRPVEAPSVALETALGWLHHGDCVTLLRGLHEGSIDLVFADPPFNLNKDYGPEVKDSLSETHYFEWSCQWLGEVVRVLKPGGSLFLYNIPRWSIPLANWLSQYLEFRHWIAVDIKFSLPIPGRLYPSHYSLLYFTKGGRPKVFAPPRLPIETCRHCGGEIRDYGGYKDRMNPRGINLTDVWTDISPVRHARFKRRRANELPVRLLDRVLDIASEQGDLVLDPFGGSGTTYVVAELKGRRWIGCEVGDCTAIVERFRALDRERETLADVRANINVLFTSSSLALRRRHGFDSSKYRLDEAGPPRVHERTLFDRE